MKKIKDFFISVFNKFKNTGTKGIVLLSVCAVLLAVLVIMLCTSPFSNGASGETDTSPVSDTETSPETESEKVTDTEPESDTDTSPVTETESEGETGTEPAESKPANEPVQNTYTPPEQNSSDIDINVNISGSSQGNSGSSQSSSGNSSQLGSSETNGRVHTYANAPSHEYEDTSNTLPFYPLKIEGATDPGGVYNKPQITLDGIKPGVVLKGNADYSTTIIGYDNFLFCGDTMGDYDGTATYSDSRLTSLISKVVKQKEWLESNGKKLYIVIVPNKNSVYSEYMPEEYPMASYRRIDQVINALRSAGITVVDGRDALLKAKKENPERLLYYKTDTHWNNHGGFEVYKDLMNEIKKDFPNAVLHTRSDYQVNYAETYMKDQAYYLGYYDATSEIGPVYTLKNGIPAEMYSHQPRDKWGQFAFAYEWPDGYCDRLYYMSFINTSNKGAPNMYILRDSYSIALIPFLKDSFYRSTFNWTYYFSKDEILKSKSDVVIIECVEKHIKDMLQASWGN